MTTIHLYDTTLRDGTQGEGFSLSVAEKIRVAHLLDDLGVRYLEGGWPGSNPRDEAFFEASAGERFHTLKVAAFGSTRRANLACEDDPSLQKLLAADVPVVTIFGKSWRFQATDVLGISAEQNLELVHDTVRFLAERVDTVIFDAEHFFDGAADDEAYALKAVLKVGVRCRVPKFVTLVRHQRWHACPTCIAELTGKSLALRRCRAKVGIHAHNDTELAVANSIEAVLQGWRPDGAGHRERVRRALRQRQPGLHLAQPSAEARLRGGGRRTAWSRSRTSVADGGLSCPTTCPTDGKAYVGEPAPSRTRAACTCTR